MYIAASGSLLSLSDNPRAETLSWHTYIRYLSVAKKKQEKLVVLINIFFYFSSIYFLIVICDDRFMMSIVTLKNKN